MTLPHAIAVTLSIVVCGYMLAPLFIVPTISPFNTYASDVYRFSFSYPHDYLLSEQNVETGNGRHDLITLIHEKDAVPYLNQKSPMAITIDIYEGGTTEDIVLWVQGTGESKYEHEGYALTNVNGVEAIHYVWSGFYEGETTALIHNNNIVLVSVTYRSLVDPIREAYRVVLESFTLR